MSTEKITVSERLNAIFRGHPILLVIMAAGVSGSFILGYRNIAVPYIEKRKRFEARKHAEILYEIDDKRTKSD